MRYEDVLTFLQRFALGPPTLGNYRILKWWLPFARVWLSPEERFPGFVRYERTHAPLYWDQCNHLGELSTHALFRNIDFRPVLSLHTHGYLSPRLHLRVMLDVEREGGGGLDRLEWDDDCFPELVWGGYFRTPRRRLYGKVVGFRLGEGGRVRF